MYLYAGSKSLYHVAFSPHTLPFYLFLFFSFFFPPVSTAQRRNLESIIESRESGPVVGGDVLQFLNIDSPDIVLPPLLASHTANPTKSHPKMSAVLKSDGVAADIQYHRVKQLEYIELARRKRYSTLGRAECHDPLTQTPPQRLDYFAQLLSTKVHILSFTPSIHERDIYSPPTRWERSVHESKTNGGVSRLVGSTKRTGSPSSSLLHRTRAYGEQ